jgi:4-carboxymuconolactone decarboxylase
MTQVSDDKDTKESKREHLYERYNNTGLDTGVRLQGEHFLHRVEEFDELDPEWTDAWLTWIYDHLYNRNILDDKTRILVILGECCVLGAEMQIPNHIRSAMRAGATEKEVLEVILQSAIYGGIPKMVVAMKHYRALMKDLGKLDLSDPVFRGDARE